MIFFPVMTLLARKQDALRVMRKPKNLINLEKWRKYKHLGCYRINCPTLVVLGIYVYLEKGSGSQKTEEHHIFESLLFQGTVITIYSLRSSKWNKSPCKLYLNKRPWKASPFPINALEGFYEIS